MKKPPEFVEKVRCEACGRYFGIITSDKRGPVFYGCTFDEKCQASIGEEVATK